MKLLILIMLTSPLIFVSCAQKKHRPRNPGLALWCREQLQTKNKLPTITRETWSECESIADE